MTALFAFIFKVPPAVRLEWGDVGAGAVAASLPFTAGKFLWGVYPGRAGVADSYGGAGSRAYAHRFGSIFAATLDPSRPHAESCLRP